MDIKLTETQEHAIEMMLIIGGDKEKLLNQIVNIGLLFAGVSPSTQMIVLKLLKPTKLK